jgi:undecaprenyl diphosphate synthase
MIALLEEKTKDKTGLTVILALNYGGRDEIVRAARKVCDSLNERNGQPGAAGESLNEEMFAAYLDTADYPDPALLIRTGGEKRLSNFLLWQSAYAELYFDGVLWPDYNISRLEEAVLDFNSRNRRFGGR